MKKKLFLLIILIVCFNVLFAAEQQHYYQIFPSAISFDLSEKNRAPHRYGWEKGDSPTIPNGYYHDDEMIGTIGVTNKNITKEANKSYGVLVHVYVHNNAEFRTNKDFSAYRNFGVEVCPRYDITNYNDDSFTTTVYSDFNCTTVVPQSHTFIVCDKTSPSTGVYFKLPMNLRNGQQSVWCDLVMLMDTDYQADSLTPDDNYYGEVTITMWPLLSDYNTVDTSATPYSFTLHCSGYYDTNKPHRYQQYNFFVTANELASYFPMQEQSSWDDYQKIGDIVFSTNTLRATSRSSAVKDYRIVLSPTPDYRNTEGEKFKFRRNGSVGEKITNTVNYSVSLVPNPVTRTTEYENSFVSSGQYIQLSNPSSSSYKSHYSARTSAAIKGNETLAKRQIQVPFYQSAFIPSGSVREYVFNYEADVLIKLENYDGLNNKDILEGGLYSSTIYLTVISEL